MVCRTTLCGNQGRGHAGFITSVAWLELHQHYRPDCVLMRCKLDSSKIYEI